MAGVFLSRVPETSQTSASAQWGCAGQFPQPSFAPRESLNIHQTLLGCVKRHFPLGDAGLSRTVSHCTVSRDCHSPHSIDMRCCVSMKTTVARSPAPNHGRSGRIVVVPVDIAPSSSRRKCFSGAKYNKSIRARSSPATPRAATQGSDLQAVSLSPRRRYH